MDAEEQVRRSTKPTPKLADESGVMEVCAECGGAVRRTNAHVVPGLVLGPQHYHESCCPHAFCGDGRITDQHEAV